jgi:uncharacterized protein with GYD domain
LFLTAVGRECDETVEMRERRHLATASVEKIFLLAPGTFRRGTMLVNFTDQGLKGVKDVPNRQDNRARQSVRIFLGADYAKEISIQIESVRLAAAPRLFVLLAVADDASSMPFHGLSLKAPGLTPGLSLSLYASLSSGRTFIS